MNTKSLYLSLYVFSLFFCPRLMAQEVDQGIGQENGQSVLPEHIDEPIGSLVNKGFAGNSVHANIFPGLQQSVPTTIPSSTSGKGFLDGYLGSKDSFSGLYLIGSVGHSSLSAPRKGKLILMWGPGVTLETGASLSSNQVIFSGGVGYSIPMPRSIFALEFLSFWDDNQNKSSSSVAIGPGPSFVSENLSKKWGLEARAKLGYWVMPNACLYGGVGIERTSFSYSYTTNVNLSGKSSKELWGAFPLAGMRVLLSEKLSLDFSYKYTFYQGLSVGNTNANAQFYRSLKPSNSIAQVGLIYKIN